MQHEKSTLATCFGGPWTRSTVLVLSFMFPPSVFCQEVSTCATSKQHPVKICFDAKPSTLKPDSGPSAQTPPESAKGKTVPVADLNVPNNAREEFEKGEKSLTDNKIDDSIFHFKKAIELCASFPQAYTMLGTAYLQLSNLRDAESALEKAIQLDPKSAEANIELGTVFNQMKNYPEAEKALKQGLDLNPDAAAGHYELAQTYWAMGRWQDAEPHVTKALAAVPDVAPVHVLMGNILLKKKDAPGALHEFQEYLRLDPNGSMAPAVRDIIDKIQKALAKSN